MPRETRRRSTARGRSGLRPPPAPPPWGQGDPKNGGFASNGGVGENVYILTRLVSLPPPRKRIQNGGLNDPSGLEPPSHPDY